MKPSRRSFLCGSAALPFGLAGRAHAASVPLRVGFVPVIGAASLFVIEGTGWARDAGLSLNLTKFDSGPAAVQAFASGTFDILAIGVAPVAVARAKGFDAVVVAAAGLGGSSFVATPDLAARFAANSNAPAAALASFRKDTGRRAKIATLPPGGVPTVALNHWFEIGKVDRSDVEIVTIGIEAIQQAMLSGAIDGGTVLEPAATLVQARNPALRVIVSALDMFPDVPGVVFAASRRVLERERAGVVSLVRLHARATELILSKPADAAPYVAAVLGSGLIEPAVMTRAMRSQAIRYVADPHEIITSTQRLLAYQATLGDFTEAPNTAGLFDTSVWDEAVRASP